ncbi:MAG: VOC family protein [Chloroflexi bacterium]|nr:VOC family protein [Chloroflexota bacterium]
MFDIRDYIVKFDHTAIGVANIGDALPLYRDLLGGKQVGSGIALEKGFQALQLEYPNGSKIELIAPLGDDSFMHKFLRERGSGVHHLTFIVKNLVQCVAHLRGLGYRVVGEDYSNPGWREAFISPVSAHGTIVQLAESDRYP